jgi:pimeloyl-ACP methyl ester carboxylesterase
MNESAPPHPAAGQFRELHYVRYGRGRPVVALHGFGETSYSWRHLLSAPAAGLAFHAIDLRGCGQSGKPPDGRYSLRDHAEEIRDLILALDLKDLTLVGHSMGGGIALLVALDLLRRGDARLRSLVLIDGLALPQTIPLFIRVARHPVLGPLALALLPPEFLVRLVMWRAFYDRRRIEDEAVAAYAASLASEGGRHALHQTARRLVPHDLEEIVASYPRIDVPTLIVWGSKDRIIPPRNAAALRAAIPHAELLAVPACGHVPHEEAPDVAVPAILAFLSRPVV